MVRGGIALFLTLVFVSPGGAVESYSYLNPENPKWGTEWALTVDKIQIEQFRFLSFGLSYGPPHWFVRARAGLFLGGDLVPGGSVGVELPLIEMDSENSNARSWGLYLRGDQQIDVRLRPLTSVGIGASFCWSGFQGPGLLVSYTSDQVVLFSLTMTGAVGFR